MTGLEKITDQIQEEAKASAARRLEAAQKEADAVIAEAKDVCAAMETETAEKIAAMKVNYEGRIKSSAEQQRRTAPPAGEAGDHRGSDRGSPSDPEEEGCTELFPDSGKNIEDLCTGGERGDLFLSGRSGQDAG